MTASIKRIIIALVFSIIFSSTAFAKTGNISAIQFRPSPFVDRTFTVDGTRTQGFGNFAVGLDIDYMYKPMKIKFSGVPTVGSVSGDNNEKCYCYSFFGIRIPC